jgi:hypothetical protein
MSPYWKLEKILIGASLAPKIWPYAAATYALKIFEIERAKS